MKLLLGSKAVLHASISYFEAKAKAEPVNEKQTKNPLLKVSREQARQWAAQLGFFGWTDFLLKLNAIESAKKGGLQKNRKR